MGYTKDLEFYGTTVISQASDSELDRIYTRVVNNVFEFRTVSGKEITPTEQKILTWSSSFRLNELPNYLFTNAHAVLSLLKLKYIERPETGNYASRCLSNNKDRSMRLRLLDRQLDMAGLLFTENSGFKGSGLNYAENDISEGQRCYVVAVPESIGNKRIVGGKIKGVYDDLFLYSCDTDNGSSGSPVLNSNGEVIGQHRGTGSTGSGPTYALATKANRLQEVTRGDLSEVSIERLDTESLLKYAAIGFLGLNLLK